MMWLSVESLAALHRYFLAHDGELTLMQFVDIMLLLCDPAIRAVGTDEAKALRLIELFHQIDVNGDGGLEWDELSAYIIESGMAAGQKQIGHASHYLEQSSLSHNNHRRQAQDIIYMVRGFGTTSVPTNGREEVVLPGGAAGVGFVTMVFDNCVQFHRTKPHGGFEESATHTLATGGGEVGEIISFVLLPEYNAALACTAGLQMVVWYLRDADFGVDKNMVETSAKQEAQVPDAQMRTPEAQRCAAWSGVTSTLYTVKGSVITSWTVTNVRRMLDSSSTLEIKRNATLVAPERSTAHADVVTALLVYPERKLLISGGFDGVVHVWNMAMNDEYMSARRGHTKGVRALAVADTGVLLSAGYDYKVFGWSLLFGVRENVPLFALNGHTSTIISVEAFGATACSMDDTGIFRYWDIRTTASVMETERNLQSFSVSEPLVRFAPTAMCFVPGSGSRTHMQDGTTATLPDVIGCDNVLYVWRAVPVRGAIDMALFTADYNPTFMSIVVPTQSDVYTFSAVTGTPSGHLAEILEEDEGASSEISSACFDERNRKLILGTNNGGIRVHNIGNGSEMKRARREIRTIIPPKKVKGRIISGLHHTTFSRAHASQVDKVISLCSDTVASMSWDGSLAIWDERAPDQVSLLRSIVCPHGSHVIPHDHGHARVKPVEVMSSAFTEKLSLLATGGADGSICVWDYLTLTPAGLHAHEWVGEHSPFGLKLARGEKHMKAHRRLRMLRGGDDADAEIAGAALRKSERESEGPVNGISSLCFLDLKTNPIPVLASGSSDGRIGLWGVRGNRRLEPQSFIGRLFSSKPTVGITALVAHCATRRSSTAAMMSSGELPEAIAEQYARMGAVPESVAPSAPAVCAGDADEGDASTVASAQEEAEGEACQWLFAADEAGWVLGWCVDDLELGVQVQPVEESRLPIHRVSYNPWSRLSRPRDRTHDDGERMQRPPLLPSEERSGRPAHLQAVAAPHVAFRATGGNIYSMRSVEGVMNSGGALLILSKGSGRGSWCIDFWSLRGECLGRIRNQFSAEGMSLGLQRDVRVAWRLDPGHREKRLREEARAARVCAKVIERHTAERLEIIMRDHAKVETNADVVKNGMTTLAPFPFVDEEHPASAVAAPLEASPAVDAVESPASSPVQVEVQALAAPAVVPAVEVAATPTLVTDDSAPDDVTTNDGEEDDEFDADDPEQVFARERRRKLEAKKQRRLERQRAAAAIAQVENDRRRSVIFAQVGPSPERRASARPGSASAVEVDLEETPVSRPQSPVPPIAQTDDDEIVVPALNTEMKKRSMYSNLYVCVSVHWSPRVHRERLYHALTHAPRFSLSPLLMTALMRSMPRRVGKRRRVPTLRRSAQRPRRPARCDRRLRKRRRRGEASRRAVYMPR